MDEMTPTDELFRQLEAGTPADRCAFVLGRLTEHRPLVLPTLPGRRLCLRDVRLDPGDMPADRLAPNGGFDLRTADLRGADFGDADLSGVDATRANLRGTVLRAVSFRSARLESAGFTDADLSSADFSGVAASEAEFAGALAEDTSFSRAVLRFAVFTDALLDGANFDGADLWSAQMDGVTATDALFRGANMQEANLRGADLSGAKFEGAELQKVNLRDAKLTGADLRGAALGRADLTGADLTGASLPRVDLSTCDLAGVRLAGAWLDNTRFQVEQLGDGIGEELAAEYGPARQGYLALEQNFRSLGQPESASWCYRKARHMGRRQAAQILRSRLRERNWRDLPGSFVRWFGDAFAEWLCDYGESLPRVVRAYLITLAAFAAFYGFTDSLRYTTEGGAALMEQPVHDPLLLAGFSFLNMCTSGVPDIGLKPGHHLVYFVSSMQYVVGVVLVGLFGYVLGNRLRR